MPDTAYSVKINGLKIWCDAYLVKAKVVRMSMTCPVCEGIGVLFTKGSKEVNCPSCKGKKAFEKRLEEYYVERDSVTQIILCAEDGISFKFEKDRQEYVEDWVFSTKKYADAKASDMNIQTKKRFEELAMGEQDA